MINISPFTAKQKEIFNKLSDERIEEITGLNKKVNPNNLIYRYKGPAADVKFGEFDNALNLLKKIKEGEISLAIAKNDQTGLRSNLGEIKKQQQQQQQQK